MSSNQTRKTYLKPTSENSQQTHSVLVILTPAALLHEKLIALAERKLKATAKKSQNAAEMIEGEKKRWQKGLTDKGNVTISKIQSCLRSCEQYRLVDHTNYFVTDTYYRMKTVNKLVLTIIIPKTWRKRKAPDSSQIQLFDWWKTNKTHNTRFLRYTKDYFPLLLSPQKETDVSMGVLVLDF